MASLIRPCIILGSRFLWLSPINHLRRLLISNILQVVIVHIKRLIHYFLAWNHNLLLWQHIIPIIIVKLHIAKLV